MGSAGKGKSSRQPRHSTRSEPTGRFLNSKQERMESAGKEKSSSAGKGKSSRQPRHSTRWEPTGRFLNREWWEALGKRSPPVNRDTRHGRNLRVGF